MANKKFSALDAAGTLTGAELAAVVQSAVSKRTTLTLIKAFFDAATATLTNKTLTAPVINSPTGIVKGDVGLGNVDNTSDANKPVSTAQAAADTTALNTAKAYADGLVVGLWDDRGNYDASVNTFPASGGSGTAGAVLKGDIWTISVAGTLGGVEVAARQTVRATADTPGQTLGNWAIGLANTDLDDSITDGITGRAPSQNAVFDALAAKQAALVSGTNIKTINSASLLGSSDISIPTVIPIACSDETTALTTGTAKVTFRMPFAFTLTDVRASVTTAPTGGTLLTVDVNESGTTILSTKLTFDASEKTTTTAATPRVISDSSLADDAEITIDIDAVGSTIAGAGLKVYLIGTKT